MSCNTMWSPWHHLEKKKNKNPTELKSLCFPCQVWAKFAGKTLCSLDCSGVKEASGWYCRLGWNSTEFETGSAVEAVSVVRKIATHPAVGGGQVVFLAPGRMRQMRFGQATSFSPDFYQAASSLQQTTLQTRCISWLSSEVRIRQPEPGRCTKWCYCWLCWFFLLVHRHV